MNQLPHFSSFDANTFPHTLETLLKKNQECIDVLLKQNKPFTWDNLMHPLDDLDDVLSKRWAPLSHLHAVMNSPELRKAYKACLPMLSAYEASVSHNQALYQALASIDAKTLNPTQQKIMTDTLRNFKLAGVALSPEKQTRFETINARLAELSNQFENNILDAVDAYTLEITDEQRLKGLPEHALLSARERAKAAGQDGFILNLEIPCYLAVVTYADDRALRETFYEAFVTRASDQGPHDAALDNTPLIQEILTLRNEKAHLLDFNSYAELSIATKMAETPHEIFDFIQTLIKPILPEAQKDVQALKQFAKIHCNISELKPWDVAYTAQKLKEAEYALNDEALRPYFPLPHVMQGVFSIIKTLYNMQLTDITQSVDTWHPDVTCYAIHDNKQQLRGYLYMDLFARPNKRGGAWMDDAQSRRKLSDGSIQPPAAFLTCNFAKSASFDVPTLSHDEVITLFHELGHCLHHVLTQVDYLSASGIAGVEWDAVELPSQFFENFCWNREALKQLSQHVETGEPLPEALFDALIASKNFQAGLHLIRQLEFSWFDFLLHEAYPGDEPRWLDEALKIVRETTQVLPTAPYNRFAQSFSHLFAGGYAAGYYSYLWAEVLSSDAFSRFEDEGVFNPQTGQDFLTQILEVGSSQKAADFFETFRGRAPTTDAFLKHHGIHT
ncbi:MAG: M3 family metallopeptidase [Gammaproteobacteria bacterium]|nr:M3 family metallopeptidase [Gammaproteobacteria bacterium]MCH9717831.1 M3 family metallopeptidase [Gammaproteobacteria bacterium]MCH9763013.1 M3 family metallopeptidase [Gammaproteobacteria bacterium]